MNKEKPFLKKLKQVGKVIWELPKDYKEGMLVPGRIYATQTIIDQLEETVFNQLTNVATLPGIVNYSFCMPDAHSGYGFPIGGVAAFDPEQGGVISPGGVGFDIGCIHPKTKVNLEYGTWLSAEELEHINQDLNLPLFDHKTANKKEVELLVHIKSKKNDKIYEIKTESGRILKITKEHPILTKEGYIKAENLKETDEVLVHSFKGTKYEIPSSEIILTREMVEKTLDQLEKTNKGSSRSQIIQFLEKNNLLELRYDSPQIPVLLKLMGFILGDGVITFVNKKEGYLHFYAKKEDLIDIKKDLEKIGIKISKIHERLRHHNIKTRYGVSDFDFEEFRIVKKCTALSALFVALGVPYGRKTDKKYRVPKWVMKAPKWHKRLFLAAFFGAELAKPKTFDSSNFYDLQLNMNKSINLKENAIDFLNDIRLLLYDLGIKSREPVNVEGNNYEGKLGNTVSLRFLIPGNPNNLIKFFEEVGYEYNKEKRKLASIAANYLKLKQENIKNRWEIRKLAKKLYDSGKSPLEIVHELKTEHTGEHFIRHSIYDRQLLLPRTSLKFESFKKYQERTCGNDGFVWDEIKEIKKEDYNGYVYDLTINDENQNFLANNMIVHNCGMRLIRTNLTLEEVQPKLKELVDLLFQMVPAGVGRKGFVKINREEFIKVITQGVKWCVDNGYGWKEDLGHIEEDGCIKGGDPKKVSDKAISRGIDQLGTLGSGNHYLEIQVAKKTNIFQPELAKKFGITKENQILIMVHCGSRGFGHQIGTDYLKQFLEIMPKYGIKILDQELACAPLKSPEGQDYYKAMACGANLAMANRQVITHQIREAFRQVFKKDPKDLDMEIIYDISHNVAKLESWNVSNQEKELIVHRKGSTRCFGPSRKEMEGLYKETGQPVIVGGSMETGSYLLVGADESEQTWGSTMHGSGRTMSRTQARKLVRGDKLIKDMEKKGIYVRAVSMSGLSEEAGLAYKNIHEVVDTMEIAGISKKVVSLIPIGNVKG
ncbi:RtcB family protein [Candidatus Woesearchaeota archaeon]|nr:RtcB family protein [Candidatus Woesearchaeota archaeon]